MVFWKPLAFFSHQLRPPERKYSAFDRKLLALYLAVRHFHYFLEARSFIAYTQTTNLSHWHSLKFLIHGLLGNSDT